MEKYMNKLRMFVKQIEIVIPLLEEQNIKRPTSMLELIIKRYKNALIIIQRSDGDVIDSKQIHINGSVRAYLETASDYENPIIEEMDKAEELFKQITEYKI